MPRSVLSVTCVPQINMSLFANVILVLSFVAGLVYWYITKNFNYWKKRNVPGPKPVPFFGNIRETSLRHVATTDLFKKLYNEHPDEKLIGIFRYWTPALLVRDPEILKNIFIKDFDNFANRGVEFSKEGLGVNLFHSDGDTWRVLRNKLSPIFTSGKLKNMMQLLNEQAEIWVNHVDKKTPKNTEIDIWKLIQKFTVGSIGATAFGMDINIEELDVKDNVYSRIDKLIFTVPYGVDIDLMFPGVLKKLNMSILPSFVNNFFESLVTKVIKQRGGAPSGRKDFMDLLLEMKNAGEIHGTKKHEDDKSRKLEITESLMSAQAFVFYAAGYETSASTVSNMLRLLALHQDVQDKVVKEINEMLENNNGDITFDGLKGMQYIGQVLDETLRMHPLVDPLQRQCENKYKIPGTDVTIDPGTMVVISVAGLHYDEKYFPNPYEFDPERFSPENAKTIHPCAYLPFGTGPRNCIGMRFAQVQTRLALVTLLQKYRVLPTENTATNLINDPWRALPINKQGLLVKIVQRN